MLHQERCTNPAGPMGAENQAQEDVFVSECHQAPTSLSLQNMCEQPVFLLCRLSLVQFVTYNPELQVFTASLLRFSFQETGSIRVSLARCWSCQGSGFCCHLCSGPSMLPPTCCNTEWFPHMERQSHAALLLLQQTSWPCVDTAQAMAAGQLTP